jgi:RNA polymerase sigma-70 factor (ECF subfamily)
MDTPPLQDQARILAAAAEGDQSAWQAIVEGYSPRVFGLIRVQCGDPDLAEEIVQSTFCTVAQKISGYKEFGRFDAWLFRIAMNRLRDEMRRRKRQARPMEEEALIGLSGGGQPTDAAQFDSESRQALARALTELSEADREIIDLRHTGGLSFRQIGALLDQPVGTLLARHHRALKKLRAILGGDDEKSGKGSE